MRAYRLATRPQRLTAWRVVTAGVAASTGLLVGIAPPGQAVIDGRPDGNGHPNVGLVVGVDSEGNGVYSCTGTLVDPTTVLTAAHCAGGEYFGVPVDQIYVDFDSELRQNADGRYVLDHYVPGSGAWDPLFNPAPHGTAQFLASSAHDVGVIRLESRADTVFPGIMPMAVTGPNTNERYRNGTDKTLVLQVGYGVQRNGAPGQPGSYFIDYTRNRSQVQPKRVTDSLLFLGANPHDAAGYGSPCSGDSGSPVIRAGKLIGLFTFSQNICNNTAGGPRLDAGPARDWLRSQGIVP